MSNRFNRLWVFGDSYTTPYVCVDPKDSFWGLAARDLSIPNIINCSRPMNSWTTNQHLLVGMQEKIDWANDLIFLCISFLERITIFDGYRDTKYYGSRFETQNWNEEQFVIDCHNGLVCLQHYGDDRELIIWHDRGWLETDALRQIFLVTRWLESLNAKYLLINLSKDFDRNNRWGPSQLILDYCLNLHSSILFENTYYSINAGVNQPVDSDGPEGHHGPIGNLYFYQESLLPKLKECGLC